MKMNNSLINITNSGDLSRALKSPGKSLPEIISKLEPRMHESSEKVKNSDKSLIFWYMDGRGNYKISPSQMQSTLTKWGIYNYYVNNMVDEIPILVKTESNKVVQVDIPFIENRLMDIIKSEGSQSVEDIFLRSTAASSGKKLFTMPTLNKKFIKDSKEYAHFFFRNAIFKVEADKIHKLDYSNSEDVVWGSQIIDHKFNPVSWDQVIENSDFYQFLLDITSHSKIESKERLNHLITLIGYILHRYKDPALPKALALMDEDISGSPNGGTGKSLLLKAISKLRKVTQEDGKNFKTGQQFSFQQVELDTEIILFDDVHKFFDLKKLFPIITEGIQVEKKYKDKFTIPYSDSPKVALTTNYAISGTGVSFRRRLYEFQLSKFYNDINTPIEKFGRRFFDGWDEDQWNMFYTTMLYACRLYLKNGVVESEPINLSDMKLVYSTCSEFADFAKEHIQLSKEYNKATLFSQFKNAFVDFENVKQRTFTSWVNRYAEVYGYTVSDRHSDNDYFFTILDSNNP